MTCSRAPGELVTGPQVVTFRRPSQVSEGHSGPPPPRGVATALTARGPWQRQPERAPVPPQPPPRDPEGPPGRRSRLPAGRAQRGLVAHLTSSSRPQRHEGLAGRPVSPRSAPQPTASRAATQPEPTSARYTPSRTPPARVRHYVFPRPGTQPHPANRSDWLPAPPAPGFQLCHWSGSNAN